MTGFEINRQPARARAVVGLSLVLLVASQAACALPAAASKGTKETKASKKSGLPSVSTGGVNHARGTSVELKGSINPRGQAATYYFQYGPTVAYGQQTPSATLPAGTTRVKVAQTVTGMQPGYHYRLLASNVDGLQTGRDHTYLPKSGALKLTLAGPSKVNQPLGGSFSVTGTVSGPGAAGRTVVLQASPYPYSEAFATVGSPQVVNSVGRFSFPVTDLSKSTQYRVSTIDPQPSYSHVVTELATVHVTFHVRTSAHSRLVRFYGTVSPAEAGARVLFQLQKPPKRRNRPPRSEKAEERAEEKAEEPVFSTKFSGVLKRATKTLSRFSSVIKPRVEGHYRAYVELAKGPLASGYSISVLVHVKKKRARARG